MEKGQCEDGILKSKAALQECWQRGPGSAGSKAATQAARKEAAAHCAGSSCCKPDGASASGCLR